MTSPTHKHVTLPEMQQHPTHPPLFHFFAPPPPHLPYVTVSKADIPTEKA